MGLTFEIEKEVVQLRSDEYKIVKDGVLLGRLKFNNKGKTYITGIELPCNDNALFEEVLQHFIEDVCQSCCVFYCRHLTLNQQRILLKKGAVETWANTNLIFPLWDSCIHALELQV